MNSSNRVALVCIIAFCVFATHARTANSQEQNGIYLDTLALKYGYVKAFHDISEINGGVTDMQDPDENGYTLSFAAVFNSGYVPGIKPYIDYAYQSFNDRHYSILGLGVRHDFEIEDSALEPYIAAGIGYSFSQWSSSPVPGTANESTDDETFGGTLKAGIDYYFTDNMALNLGLRWDFYSLDTTIIDNNTITTIRDESSFNIMAGLVYRFGAESKKDEPEPKPKPEPIVIIKEVEKDDTDSDGDTIADRFDRCPDTLLKVPVNENGCPHEQFAINLNFKFAEFKISHIVNRPSFDVVAFLQKHPNYHIHITGHCDNVGGDAVNQKISEQRAAEARDLLLAQGFKVHRIKISGKGATEPIASNDTAEGRLMNRRIHVEFIKVPGSASVQ